MSDNTDMEKKRGIVSNFKNSVLFKLGSIVILIAILLLPLGMIDSLLEERLARRSETISAITSTWGKEQVIIGPVLMVPYRYYYQTMREQITKKGKEEIKRQIKVTENKIIKAYFLPEQLNIEGALSPETLHRGIYDAIVYTGKLKIQGTFARPDFAPFNAKAKDIFWEDAKISFAITDLRGTQETLVLALNDQKLPLIPGGLVPDYPSGVHASLKGLLNNKTEALNFNLAFTLNGSSSLNIAPLGKQNDVTLQSTWKDPSFMGEFLPVKREVSAKGFEAHWKVSYYGRHYPQYWNAVARNTFTYNIVQKSLFGVKLVSLIDSYRNVERSIKYGVLFITLIFTAFFLFEVVGNLKIHPFQYILVGAALCLFYLALLSFSEFMSFILSYISAASISTLLITLYCVAVLKSGMRSLFVAVGLITTYGFLYVTLQATDYALIIGTIGLFMALSLVMYATRDIDWYAHQDAQ
ncbi:MAG: cell envelope integrity protein CreD [Methylococcales bacterium]|nr:cell envelope integrity protein CreD [Methylococcales bacterium]